MDSFLDSLTPEQFDELVAYHTIDADPTDRLVAILRRGFAIVAAGFGAKIEEKDIDPWFGDEQDRAGSVVSPNEAVAALRAMVGR